MRTGLVLGSMVDITDKVSYPKSRNTITIKEMQLAVIQSAGGAIFSSVMVKQAEYFS